MPGDPPWCRGRSVRDAGSTFWLRRRAGGWTRRDGAAPRSHGPQRAPARGRRCQVRCGDATAAPGYRGLPGAASPVPHPLAPCCSPPPPQERSRLSLCPMGVAGLFPPAQRCEGSGGHGGALGCCSVPTAAPLPAVPQGQPVPGAAPKPTRPQNQLRVARKQNSRLQIKLGTEHLCDSQELNDGRLLFASFGGTQSKQWGTRHGSRVCAACRPQLLQRSSAPAPGGFLQ